MARDVFPIDWLSWQAFGHWNLPLTKTKVWNRECNEWIDVTHIFYHFNAISVRQSFCQKNSLMFSKFVQYDFQTEMKPHAKKQIENPCYRQINTGTQRLHWGTTFDIRTIQIFFAVSQNTCSLACRRVRQTVRNVICNHHLKLGDVVISIG